MKSVISQKERQSQSHAAEAEEAEEVEEEWPKLSGTSPELPPLTSPTTANAPLVLFPDLYPLISSLFPKPGRKANAPPLPRQVVDTTVVNKRSPSVI
jgi:hypothetical protein